MAQIRWDRVTVLQQAHGWSDRELARRMRFSAAHLCDVKRGYRKPSIEFIDTLCEVLQLSYERIIEHPSIKPAEDRRKTRWYDGTPRKRPSRLCNDPEHPQLETPKERRHVELAVSRLIPQQSRKRFWAMRWGREIKM